MPQTKNLRIAEFSTLVTPRELEAELPATETISDVVTTSRDAISDMLHGKDQAGLVVVVGPCSIHEPDAAFEYAEKLKKVADATRGRLLVIMRTYFEKPRTVVGWKGLISDPHLDGSCDIEAGLTLARTILRAITGIGLPCATEFLDTVVPHYLSDMVSWAAIGARTTESQVHRQMASGLSMPVGFKNGTDGSLQNAINAVRSARHAHAFLGIDADGMSSVVRTTGNRDAHVVLRGGSSGPNYGAADIASAAAALSKEDLIRAVMVDCSHDNSGKNHTKQAAIMNEVVDQFVGGQKAILGVMLESNLSEGRQDWMQGVPLRHGVSITDACIGWSETEELLLKTAERIARACPAPGAGEVASKVEQGGEMSR